MLLLLLLSCIFYGATAQQSASIIEKVSSLITTSNSYWSSDSGHFAFGFYQQGDGFALGIWMPRIQQKTVIWTANLNDPPLPSDVTLTLNTDESKIIRQTFASPTDNIVSEQRLLAGQKLVSSTSNTNQSSGGFELNMQTDGNLVMYPAVLFARVAAYAYWSTATYTAGNNVSLNLDSNGQLYLLNSTGFTIKTLKERAIISGNPIYRGTIDEDGIFRLYLHNLDQNSNWSVEWSSSSKCDPINLCGLNSYCTLVDQDSACICLPGFEFVDQGQENLGCKRNSTLDDCISFRESNITMQELTSISWEDDPYYILESSTSIACRDERLGDC
ncbi:G-type lectin S-receptor-like serine/threonine-protein kinase LECRK3 [Ricinus communis]|uniref:G-type lectin S-receptor-like serine/threonine-protein kinase LECRK3 n=1 Tax=Ricinus communis TaxID=3988 RepID=UPI00201A2EE3|nr:G-type lectin S-receptor-like serine/threonine-protein kinase LECRK3 [Ricinus communis]